MQSQASAREKWNAFYTPGNDDNFPDLQTIMFFKGSHFKDKNVLDFGIGQMQYPELAEQAKFHCGVDISEKALTIAKEVSNGRFALLQADCRMSPILSNSFDTVMSIDLISQSGTAAFDIMKEMHRITSDLAIIQVAHSDFAESAGGTLERLEFGQMLRKPTEFALFNEEGIKGFLRSIGFEIEYSEVHIPYLITGIKDKSKTTKAPADGFIGSEDTAKQLSEIFELKVLEWPLIKSIFVEARKEK